MLKFGHLYCINELLANYVLLVSKILLGIFRSIMAKKIGDKSCQSNFDKRSSDFSHLITTYCTFNVSWIMKFLTFWVVKSKVFGQKSTVVE